jgi:ribonuclease VapC
VTIDSSALVAILLNEAECDEFLLAVRTAAEPAISVVNLMETSIVVRRTGGERFEARIDELLVRLAIRPLPVDLFQTRLARDAHRRFGKGTGHPAKLNFGDCFAYALAKTSGRPLLFKGAGFALTDIEPAVNAGFSPTG